MGQPNAITAAGELFDYGIQTEGSNIRCHVAPGTRNIFVFRTDLAVALLPGRYEVRPAFQAGVKGPTAKGYLVPWRDVPDIRRLKWESCRWWERFDLHQSTSAKGRQAVVVVIDLLRSGRFPLWISAEESERAELQLHGTDVLLWGRWKIQVKCDWKAGDPEEGGSGNLFLQIAERNPLKRR